MYIERELNRDCFRHSGKIIHSFDIPGCFSTKHFIVHESNGPDIVFHGVGFAIEDLGGHVEGGSTLLGHLFIMAYFSGETIISYFEAIVVNEGVFRFDVSMGE